MQKFLFFFLFSVYIVGQPLYIDTTYVRAYFAPQALLLSSIADANWMIVNIDSMQAVPVYKCIANWSEGLEGVTKYVNSNGVYDTLLLQAGRHYNNCWYEIYVYDVLLTTGHPIVEDNVHNKTTYFADYPLPVELISFSGQQKGIEISLKWRTETEVNNYGFEIERKFAFSNWEKTGFIVGYGNSNSPKNYSYQDSLRVGKQMPVFYRLKQIDTDGTYEYHRSISIDLVPVVEKVDIKLFPNPFNSAVTAKFSYPYTENTYLQVYTVLGELVSEQLLTDDSGVYSVDMNFFSRASGIYIFVLKSDKFIAIKKGILLK